MWSQYNQAKDSILGEIQEKPSFFLTPYFCYWNHCTSRPLGSSLWDIFHPHSATVLVFVLKTICTLVLKQDRDLNQSPSSSSFHSGESSHLHYPETRLPEVNTPYLTSTLLRLPQDPPSLYTSLHYSASSNCLALHQLKTCDPLGGTSYLCIFLPQSPEGIELKIRYYNWKDQSLDHFINYFYLMTIPREQWSRVIYYYSLHSNSSIS